MEQNNEMKRKWTGEEDSILRHYVNIHGAGNWETLATNIGIGRNGNSCRQRWNNYLSPHINRAHGVFSDDEMRRILTLHSQFGKRWARIAEHLPGRTDNDVKNFWNTRVKKEARKLGCDAESEEFRRIMTARLEEGIQSPPPSASATAEEEYDFDVDYIWGNVANATDYTLY